MQLKLPVEDASHVAEARRECIRIAERAGFGEADAGRVGIVVTELATNLLKHATSGVLIAGLIEAPSGYAVQILSLDKGDGIRGPGGSYARRLLDCGQSRHGAWRTATA